MTAAIDIEDYNARWLAAWTAKDVEGLLGFYGETCTYKDPQTVQGIVGHDALRAYLTGLFAAVPAMTYTPETVWPIPGGFCGRWYCTIETPGGVQTARGFDMVLLDGDRITWNEVYLHPGATPPA